MSFSKEVKKEILSSPNKSQKECLAFLCGLTYASGEYEIDGDKVLNFSFCTDLEELNLIVGEYLSIIYDEKIQTQMQEVFKIGKTQYYKITLPDELAKKLLISIEALTDGKILEPNNKVSESQLESEESLKGFMRGSYIGCGTSSIKLDEKDRTTTGYHLEFNSQNYNLLFEISQILAQFDILPKLTKRKNLYVLYIKDAEQVSNMLALMGASDAVLGLQNEIITRQMRNKINRQNNCFTSNYNKTLQASYNQLKSIKLIDEEVGVYNLPEDLCQVALLRLANEEQSLEELLKLSKTPMTKSALNYKFQKLMKLAEKIKKNNEKISKK